MITKLWLIYTAIHKVLDYQEMSLLSPPLSLHGRNRSGLVSTVFLKRPINVLHFSRPFAALWMGRRAEKDPLTGQTIVSFVYKMFMKNHVCLWGCGNNVCMIDVRGAYARCLRQIRSERHSEHLCSLILLSVCIALKPRGPGWNLCLSGCVQACVTQYFKGLMRVGA